MSTRTLTRTVILCVTIAVLSSPSSARGSTPTDPWEWPLGDRNIEHAFELPDSDYGPGHRGIDLAGEVGDVVRSVAAGRVTFVGRIAGVPMVSVTHGGERSTYQPVQATVRTGDAVEAGEPIGRLLGSASHCPGACLHLGRIDGNTYLDPTLNLTVTGRFRLIDPSGDPPPPPVGIGSGQLRRPVSGRITSPFGMRVHPITRVRKLHDGLDFGAACGTPVHAASGGTVVRTGRNGAYGLSVRVEAGHGLATSYNHLSAISVRTGDRVAPGRVVGRVGSTGLSTGCHLHFMVYVKGSPKNPQNYL